MPRNEGSSNRRRNKTEAGKELNNQIPEHLPEQELSFVSRSPIHVGMPPLITYVSQQSHNIGESRRQLERHVMSRNSWVSNISRAIHLPILSKVFNFVQRTTALITPMYQRMLDLPWFRRRQAPKPSFTQTRGVTAARQENTISRQQNKLYTDVLLQNSGNTKEEQMCDDFSKADENYIWTTGGAYPIINSTLLLPRLIRREPALATRDIPHVITPRALSRHDLKVMAKYDQNVQMRTSYFDAKEQLLSRANEPRTVTRNMVSLPTTTMRGPDFDLEVLPYTRPTQISLGNKQIALSLKSEDSNESLPFHVGQRDTIAFSMNTTYEIRKSKCPQAEEVECKLTEVNRQPDLKNQIRTLPSVLIPIAQRTKLHRKPIEAGSRIINQNIGEIRSSNTLGTEIPDKPIKQALHAFDHYALSQQTAALEPESILHTSPDWSGLSISREAIKKPSSTKATIIARYPNALISSNLMIEALTESEGIEMPPGSISRQSVSQVGRAWRQKPLVTSSIELAGQKARAIYQTKGKINKNQSSDALNLFTLGHASIGQDYDRGQVNEPLLYRQPLSVDGSVIQPAPQTLLTSTLQSRIQSKAESNLAYRDELSKNRPDRLTEITYSGKQNLPELVLTSISRQPETPTQTAVPQTSEAGGSEWAAKDKLDDIARDVYHILKRRLARERERSLGVI